MDDKQYIQQLKAENRYLKQLLISNGIEYKKPIVTQNSVPYKQGLYDVDRYGIPDKAQWKIDLFRKYFVGRADVFSRRFISSNGNKTGYAPVCLNQWVKGKCFKGKKKGLTCRTCEYRKFKALTDIDIYKHLEGSDPDFKDVIGLYPMLPNDTCKFLVFDFDDHNDSKGLKCWKEEISFLREVCEENGVSHIVEISRSGNGAHLWLFFANFILARKARKFAEALLAIGFKKGNFSDFSTFDRMIPMQDTLTERTFGNLIALPLQGRARVNHNSMFVNKEWQPYTDYWGELQKVEFIKESFIDTFLAENKISLPVQSSEVNNIISLAKKPENKNVSEKLLKNITFINYELSDKIYINISTMSQSNINIIKSLSTFSNPLFYKRQKNRNSTYGIPRLIDCSDEGEGVLTLPRGCNLALEVLLNQSKIEYNMVDRRYNGRPIKAKFTGKLYIHQKEAAIKMLKHDMGILNATTGFGKTVVGAYLISKIKRNTMILVHTRAIQQRWKEDLEKFLIIDTKQFVKTKRKQNSIVGMLRASKNSIQGVIDVVSIDSLGKGDNIKDYVKKYGLVLVDEAHHSAAITYENVLREITAKHIYGLTATINREDGLSKIIFMQLGPIRYQMTTKERVASQSFTHYIYPRFTRFILDSKEKLLINDMLKALSVDKERNRQIITDVKDCIKKGRKIIILSKFVEHVYELAKLLENISSDLLVLTGSLKPKERKVAMDSVKQLPADKPFVIIATAQYVGEGFDVPQLDTLFYATPIAGRTVVEQYTGRINRDFEGKTDAIVYDYIDINVLILERMYNKRLRAYKSMGYKVHSEEIKEHNNKSGIYDETNYKEIIISDFERAKETIVIYSNSKTITKFKEYKITLREAQIRGVKVTIINKKQALKTVNELKRESIVALTKDISITNTVIVDKEIVWFGDINIFANTNDDASSIRISDTEIASILLERIYNNAVVSN